MEIHDIEPENQELRPAERCPHCGGDRVIKVWPDATEESSPRLFRQRNCRDCFRMFVAPWHDDPATDGHDPGA